jgi:Ni,Fe-hydrogenase I cytochrome b subunit
MIEKEKKRQREIEYIPFLARTHYFVLMMSCFVLLFGFALFDLVSCWGLGLGLGLFWVGLSRLVPWLTVDFE